MPAAPARENRMRLVERTPLSPVSGHEAAMMNVAHEEREEISEDLFFVTASAAMRKFRMQAELVAKINVPVLILGESGSGKESTARLIHKLSVRSECPFFKVNCAALPAELLDSELFGHEQGAFAGAMRSRQGKFELCKNGTILLDEITEMPLPLQAKLLQVLREKKFFRVGGDTAISADVRILATSKIKIEEALLSKRLREDLYFRLNAFTMQVPPLRERKEEIPILLGHFMQQLAKHYNLQARPLSPLLLTTCQEYSWPGNLRELENVVKRYLVIGDEFLELGELGNKTSATQDSDSVDMGNEDLPLASEDNDRGDGTGLKSLVRNLKGEAERGAIASTLEKTHWNRKAAARELGISYRSLLYKIHDYQLVPPGGYTPTWMTSTGPKRSGQGQ
jgi:two-component system response regulator AtoC